MFGKLNKKAQTTAEYAILIAIVVGAVIAMQVYVRRGLQGRIRDVVDYTSDVTADLGGQGTDFSFTAAQYEPYYAASETATAQQTGQQEVLGTKGELGRSVASVTGQAREQVSAWDAGDMAGAQTTPEVTLPTRPSLPDVQREQ